MMTSTAFEVSVSAYREAAGAFAELVRQVPPSAWVSPALGAWTVRDLVGHTSRSLTTVETYLGTAGAGPTLAGPAAYFLAAREMLADPEAVAQRGRDAGAALGDAPAARIAELVERVPALVEASAYDAPVGTPIGTMTLATYLPTRLFELVVHSLDLARALDVAAPPGLAAGIPAACELAGELASYSADPARLLASRHGQNDPAARPFDPLSHPSAAAADGSISIRVASATQRPQHPSPPDAILRDYGSSSYPKTSRSVADTAQPTAWNVAVVRISPSMASSSV